jgi:DNA polymerase-3 subunit delta'
LGTIQSRVQLIQLQALADVEMQDFMIAQGINAQESLQATRMALGNYREAQNLLAHTQNDYYPIVRDWFNYLFTNNGPAILQWVLQNADAGREPNKLLLQYIITMMGYLVRLKNVGAQNMLLQAAEQDLLQKLIAKNVSEEMTEKISNICDAAISHIERNVNTKIVLHAISLEAKDVFNGKALYL